MTVSALTRIRNRLRMNVTVSDPAPPAPAPAGAGDVVVVTPVEVPRLADHRSGPPTASAYIGLPDQLSGVRVRRPKAMIPGSIEYPHEVLPGPPLPPTKKRLSHREWSFFPTGAMETPPRPWRFPASMDNPSCRWLQTLKRMYANPITYPASISPDGGMLLHSIVRNVRPKLVVETGTFLGMSAMWIAAALAENGDGGVLHCFDDFVPIKPGPWREVGMDGGVLELVAANMQDAGLADNVILHPGSASYELHAAREELREAGGVQLAYLDADHRPMGVTQDFWAVEPVIPTGGLVVLHDTFPGVCGDEGPRFLLDHINNVGVGAYQVLDLYLSPVNYGLGLLRRVG